MKTNNIAVVLGGLIFILTGGLSANTQAAASDEGLQLGGSVRGRFESFSYSANADGTKKDSRNRLRYRLRIDGKAKVNPRAGMYFRLVSGNDSRSGNVTLGDPSDFAPNTISIRHAALTFSPWEGGKMPSGKGSLKFDFGRVKNSYKWKGRGKDMMLWDGDIALSGAGAQFDHSLGGSTAFFANTGYYIIDESSTADNDPYMLPFQAGLVLTGDETSAGLRGTYYSMSQLNADFVSRGVDGTNTDGSDGATSSGGNIADGLTGDADGGDLQVVSTQGFVSHLFGETPVVLSGGYSKNTSAKASEANPNIGENAVAYNLGIEAGSKKKTLLVGTGWYHIEANAFPSQFIDSDVLDGFTNREGLLVYLSKTVMKNTDFNIAFFSSDVIEADVEFGDSTVNAKRKRLQVDMIVKF